MLIKFRTTLHTQASAYLINWDVSNKNLCCRAYYSCEIMLLKAVSQVTAFILIWKCNVGANVMVSFRMKHDYIRWPPQTVLSLLQTPRKVTLDVIHICCVPFHPVCRLLHNKWVLMSLVVATKWSILHVRPPWLQLSPPLFMHVLWLSILKNISRWYKCKDETVLIILGWRLKYSGRNRPLPIAAGVMNYLHN